jgi:hypothetical protein
LTHGFRPIKVEWIFHLSVGIPKTLEAYITISYVISNVLLHKSFLVTSIDAWYNNPCNTCSWSKSLCIFGLGLFTILYIIFMYFLKYISYVFIHIGGFHLTIKLWPNLIMCWKWHVFKKTYYTNLTSHDLEMEIININSFIICTLHALISCIENTFDIDLLQDVKFIWDSFIHKFILYPSTHLFMCQTCFQCMIFVCKMYKFMNERNSHDFHY